MSSRQQGLHSLSQAKSLPSFIPWCVPGYHTTVDVKKVPFGLFNKYSILRYLKYLSTGMARTADICSFLDKTAYATNQLLSLLERLIQAARDEKAGSGADLSSVLQPRPFA